MGNLNRSANKWAKMQHVNRSTWVLESTKNLVNQKYIRKHCGKI